MTIEDFKTLRNNRTEDLIRQIQKHNCTIANIVRSAYERGYCDGSDSKVLTNEISTTFGDLKVGNKFKVHDETTTFIKTVIKTVYLAYDTETSRCTLFQEDYPVVPIMDGD